MRRFDCILKAVFAFTTLLMAANMLQATGYVVSLQLGDYLFPLLCFGIIAFVVSYDFRMTDTRVRVAVMTAFSTLLIMILAAFAWKTRLIVHDLQLPETLGMPWYLATLSVFVPLSAAAAVLANILRKVPGGAEPETSPLSDPPCL